MFVFTMNKGGLRRAGAIAACVACLAGTVALVGHFAGGTVAAQAGAQPTINTTQDIADYFTGRGLEIDPASAAVDKVKIPKKWDDSFLAFNTVVGESGATLEKYKGKTVEKWTALCPALSDGQVKASCVLLVYKTKPVGAYLLQQPGGEVTGLETAAARLAQQTAAAQFGQEVLEGDEVEAAAEAPDENAWPVE